jgi:hypothetical protein
MKPKTVGRFAGQVTGETPFEMSGHCAGFSAENIVLTLAGEMPASEISIGDRVITRDSGVAIVRSVTSRQAAVQAVRILAGSLGHTRPECDVMLPSGQPILVRDWRAQAMFNTRQAMVPAYRLIDGEFITDAGTQEMSLYHLHFDAPHILYVEGLELASDAATMTSARDKAA